MTKDWFKARNTWGAAILALSDAEAGRLAKALWTYTTKHEELPLPGAEKGLFALILETLGCDERKAADIAKKRAAAGSAGGKQKVANASKAKQNVANASNCYQMLANASKESTPLVPLSPPLSSPPSPPPTTPTVTPPIIPPVNPPNPPKELSRFAPPTQAEVEAYCMERGNAVNAQVFCDFYASKGWRVGNQSMKDWKAAVRTWERSGNRGYGKTVTAQRYTQRNYSENDLNALGDDLIAEARAMR